MSGKIYISNLSPAWPVKRQEALLTEALPGWQAMPIYRDILDARTRQGAGKDTLPQRADLLRGTNRRADTVTVAALPVLARAGADFLAVLDALAARRSTLVALDAGLTLAPDATAAERDQAVRVFAASRLGAVLASGRAAGAAASAKARNDASQAACAFIAERWAMPIRDYDSDALIAEAATHMPNGKITRNTVVKWLGTRRDARQKFLDKQKRKVKSNARK